MKKVLLLGIALLLVSSVASAQLPPWGYYALVADEARSTNCVAAPMMTEVWCYLYAKPGADQLMCFDFGTVMTGAAMVAETSMNDDIAQPGPTAFINVNVLGCFNSCYSDWVEIGRAKFFIYPAVEPVIVEMTNYPGSEWPKLLSCVGGIEYEGRVWTRFMLNTGECDVGELETGVTESTWGAIKNMYE
jgi:hypothetical protein